MGGDGGSMNAAQRERFSELLGDALGFYGQAVTAFSLSVWWQACERYEFEQVAKALTAHAMDPDRGQFAPKPADIVRQLQGTHTDRSLMAWGKVFEAMQRIGAYTSVDFGEPAIHCAIEDMGGWQKLCRSTMDELPFVQKRFCETHKAYSLRGDMLRDIPALMGELEQRNRIGGHPTKPPVRIGPPKALQLRGDQAA